MKTYAMSFVAAVLLTACGGSNPNGPDPFPTPTPTPAPGVVVKSKTFSDLWPDGLSLAGLSGIGPARLEARVDWTNSGNTIWVVILDDPCLVAYGAFRESQLWDEGLCNLGPPVKGGSKPAVATGVLTREYKLNEESISICV